MWGHEEWVSIGSNVDYLCIKKARRDGRADACGKNGLWGCSEFGQLGSITALAVPTSDWAVT